MTDQQHQKAIKMSLKIPLLCILAPSTTLRPKLAAALARLIPSQIPIMIILPSGLAYLILLTPPPALRSHQFTVCWRSTTHSNPTTAMIFYFLFFLNNNYSNAVPNEPSLCLTTPIIDILKNKPPCFQSLPVGRGGLCEWLSNLRHRHDSRHLLPIRNFHIWGKSLLYEFPQHHGPTISWGIGSLRSEDPKRLGIALRILPSRDESANVRK